MILYNVTRKTATPQMYLEHLQNMVSIIEHCGGLMGLDPHHPEGIQSIMSCARQSN